MIKSILSVILIFCFVVTAEAQQKKRDKVKRKYRNVETVNEKLPEVFFSGEVHDAKGKPIPGASVLILGLRNCVHTNENGEFLLKKLITGRLRVEVSCIGYKTKTSDFFLQAGPNFHNVALDEEKFHIEPLVVNTQKRLQQIPDIPGSLHSFTFRQINLTNTNSIESISGYLPGFSARGIESNYTSYSIRGITSGEIFPGIHPRVAVLFNDVPVNQQNGTSFELFDMEHVTVQNGPQNVLAGADALSGAIQYNTIYPSSKKEAYFSAGLGNFGKREFRGAYNYPILKNKVFARAAAFYNKQEGYIKNTFGGTLNGYSGFGGRLSLRFLPAYNQRGDLVINYQRDKNPGAAFINPLFPNALSDSSLFSGNASLNKGKWLGNGKELLGTTLRYRFYLNENSYFSSVSSYNASESDSRRDGDGTASETSDFSDFGLSRQYFQELRFNFSRKSRLNGSIGANYRNEKSDKTFQFNSNEQHLASFLFTQNPVDSSGNPAVIQTIPIDFAQQQLAGKALSGLVSEELKLTSKLQSAEVFLDFTFQLMKRLYVTLGARGVYFMQKLNSDSVFSSQNGVLGNPNLVFTPHEPLKAKNNSMFVTWRGGLRYRFSPVLHIFANHSKGMRPKSMQFSNLQNTLISDFETVMNYETGYNLVLFSKVNLKTTGFYQNHTGFGYSEPALEPENTPFPSNLGKSTSMGVETTVNAAVYKGINFFGNYTWLNSKLDKTNISGQNQLNAQKTMLYAPRNSFSAGLEAGYSYKKLFRIYFLPVYTYKSEYLMRYSNGTSPDMSQAAFGIFNLNGGFELLKYKIALSFYGNNILENQYIRETKEIRKPTQIVTSVPGFPKMFGARLSWNF